MKNQFQTKKLAVLGLIMATASLPACMSVQPQSAANSIQNKKVSVAAQQLPTPTFLVGRDMASPLYYVELVANIAKSDLDRSLAKTQVPAYQTLGQSVATNVQAKGAQVQLVNLDVKTLPRMEHPAGQHSYAKNLTDTNAGDYILVLEPTFIGLTQNKFLFIPTTKKQAAFFGNMTLVSTHDNQIVWQDRWFGRSDLAGDWYKGNNLQDSLNNAVLAGQQDIEGKLNQLH
ncbi:hypothetical protein BKE30_14705 [Alkanindiges hydrocarboniclasticus]|uniref:Lipoprotein n=2 Tax=Alkanindiges hydrocarboniclasticus TaxID=1907941 RepID=A0A1S8CQH2_9GAMM|nr:hypothetical protein BKE30_14705 [Alkanindiges hydrocarboniclasticus]